ncbi:protein spitz-like [Phlebotomus argentipes]|uniref:protein spitz-like n=1 Tax=Phlebotomus argentipes TaxID=94469 RepID=UPI002892FC1A|nr:protein spitz-like [Phlebotomus argentipes]XP_059620843.1 protein spitz-like [Phlebotomus argentipes]
MEVQSTERLTRYSTPITSSVSSFITSDFYKFLARFSGRRRHNLKQWKYSIVPILLLCFSTFFSGSDACSSRTTPKPRPPTPTSRPNITFHTYKCPPAYAAWYCLNEATCFTVKIGDSLLYNCECADGYMGPRCEYKDLDGSYLPSRPRVMLETASIASGVAVAFLLVVIFCIVFYMRWTRRQKERMGAEENGNGCDVVDARNRMAEAGGGNSERRPFGPHHYHKVSLSEALKR